MALGGGLKALELFALQAANGDDAELSTGSLECGSELDDTLEPGLTATREASDPQVAISQAT